MEDGQLEACKMKERPILFTPENAQKVFDGVKTQTRRIVKFNSAHRVKMVWSPKNWHIDDPDVVKACPHGVVGDRLWIRENGWECPYRTERMLLDGADTWEPFYYDALLDQGEADELKEWGFKRRPSIHMPRWACRSVVELTNIRVERVQDISDEDIRAEGVKAIWPELDEPMEAGGRLVDEATLIRDGWSALWCVINGVESWQRNDWVWVLEFKKL